MAVPSDEFCWHRVRVLIVGKSFRQAKDVLSVPDLKQLS
jgi:hypothetical protein